MGDRHKLGCLANDHPAYVGCLFARHQPRREGAPRPWRCMCLCYVLVLESIFMSSSFTFFFCLYISTFTCKFCPLISLALTFPAVSAPFHLTLDSMPWAETCFCPCTIPCICLIALSFCTCPSRLFLTTSLCFFYLIKLFMCVQYSNLSSNMHLLFRRFLVDDIQLFLSLYFYYYYFVLIQYGIDV